MSQQFLIFTTTFLIQFIIAIEMNMIGPVGPFLSEYFNIQDSYVILFNLGYSAVSILVPFLGILSDRYGKKRILGFAVILFIFGTIIAGLAKSPLLFAFGRVFIGLGYYSLSGTNLSYVSEFIDYENRGKASGILRIAFGLAILFTPIYSTTLIERYNNVSSVYLPLTVLALVAYLLLLKLPETKKAIGKKFDKEEFIQLLRDHRSRKIFASIFFITTAPAMLLNFLGIHLTSEFNLTQVEVGIAYTLIAVGTISGIFIAAILTDKLGKINFSRVMFGIMVLALIPIPYVKNLPVIIFLVIMFAFGLDGGWTAYQTFASEILPEKRGTFMSLFYTVNAITVTFYSIVGSIIYSIGGFNLAVAIGTICSAIGFIMVNQLRKID